MMRTVAECDERQRGRWAYLNSLSPSITCTPCSYNAASPSAPTEAKWPFERTDGAVGLLSNPEGRRSVMLICAVLRMWGVGENELKKNKDDTEFQDTIQKGRNGTSNFKRKFERDRDHTVVSRVQCHGGDPEVSEPPCQWPRPNIT